MASRFNVLVCRGPECGDRRDGAALYTAFEEALRRAAPLPAQVELGRYSCFGRCRRGPNVLVREVSASESPMMVRMMPTAGPGAVLYHGVRPDEVPTIVEEHIRGGRRLQALMVRGAPSPAELTAVTTPDTKSDEAPDATGDAASQTLAGIGDPVGS